MLFPRQSEKLKPPKEGKGLLQISQKQQWKNAERATALTYFIGMLISGSYRRD